MMTDNELERELMRRVVSRAAVRRFCDGEIRLSAIGHCHRQQFFEITNPVAAAVHPVTAAYYERGRMVEDWFCGILTEGDEPFQEEMEVPHPYGVGHIDFWFPTENYFIELKTSNQNTEPYLPKSEHLLQVQAYHHYGRQSGAMNEKTRAYLIYVLTGGPLKMRVYEIPYDADLAAIAISGMDRLHESITRLETPPISEFYDDSSFPCSFQSDDVTIRCPFWDRCWGADAEPGHWMPRSSNAAIDEFLAAYRKYKTSQAESQAAEMLMKSAREIIGGMMDESCIDTLESLDYVIKRRLIHRAGSLSEARLRENGVTSEQLETSRGSEVKYTTWEVK